MRDERRPMKITAQAVISLHAFPSVSREELEEKTLHVQEVLDERTLDLTEGASASANFKTCSIEVDVTLDGESMAEIHQRLAIILGRLERYCELNVAQALAASTSTVPRIAVGSTATSVAAPVGACT
jgi:hypothetical protein